MQRIVCCALLVLGACAHSDAFESSTWVLGPESTSGTAQLTFNENQDYWPSWTQDGRGILYAFVDEEHPLHRCIGLLPPGGGTRRWQWCDNRGTRADSISSYEAFALDSTGQLLVAEAVTVNSIIGVLPHTTLWISDTARPDLRTNLLTLPVRTENMVVTWLADLQWTGPATFLALGQVEGDVKNGSSGTRDTVFAQGGSVLRGTIADGKATLVSIPGTDSATGYSLANGGATLAFTILHDARVFSVPLAGGVPVPERIRRTGPDTVQTLPAEPTGVTCQGSICIVARDSVTVFGAYIDRGDPLCSTLPCQRFGSRRGSGGGTLHRVSLATGSDDLIASPDVTYQTPKVSPVSGDVVVQAGGSWGHLQTVNSPGSNLQLLKGILH